MFRSFLTLTLVTGICTPLFSQEPEKPKGRRVAFLAVVEEYSGTGLSQLKASQSEALLLTSALKQAGYRAEDIVVLKENKPHEKERFRFRPTAKNILAELTTLCESLNPEDTLLFVYTGHSGVVQKFQKKGLQLFPLDTRLSTQESLIPLTSIYELLDQKCKAQAKTILLAPCRKDSIAEELTEYRLDGLTCPELPKPPKGIAILSATAKGETSLLETNGRVNFFMAFIDAILGFGSKTETVTGKDVVEYLQKVFPTKKPSDILLGDTATFEKTTWAINDESKIPQVAACVSQDIRIRFEKNDPTQALMMHFNGTERGFGILDPITGKFSLEGVASKEIPLRASFNHTGSRFYFGTAQGTIEIVDVKTGKVIQRFKHRVQVGKRNPESPIGCFSPDGKAFLSRDTTGACFLWDIQTGEQLTIFSQHVWKSEACFIDTKRIATLSWQELGEKLQIWSAASGLLLWEFETRLIVKCVVPSLNGKYIAIGTNDDSVLVFDARKGDLFQKIDLKSNLFQDAIVSKVTFSPDSKQVACATKGAVIIWDLGQEKITNRLTRNHPTELMAFNQNGTTFVTAGIGGVAQLWDRKTGKVRTEFKRSDEFVHLALSPDGSRLVGINQDGEISTWDTETGRRVGQR